MYINLEISAVNRIIMADIIFLNLYAVNLLENTLVRCDFVSHAETSKVSIQNSTRIK